MEPNVSNPPVYADRAPLSSKSPRRLCEHVQLHKKENVGNFRTICSFRTLFSTSNRVSSTLDHLHRVLLSVLAIGDTTSPAGPKPASGPRGSLQ